MHEAEFYVHLSGSRVQCGLCRIRCIIADGARGLCGVRENRGGTLYSLVYGQPVAEQVDPIEKKPLFHVLPGSTTYSIATMGCNFRCRHCQNHSISQVDGRRSVTTGQPVPPEVVVRRALAAGCRSISYTYTEPTVYYEYAHDTAVLARSAGLKNVFVTNGYITTEALTRISPYLDAANIDLKGFSDSVYREATGAMLTEVLDSIRQYRRLGIWIELTTLIIPTINDSEDELRELAQFIVNDLGSDTPWHVTGFHPAYRMQDIPRTPPATLRRARELGRAAGLKHVYEGNLPGQGAENTICPGCGSLLVERYGFSMLRTEVHAGRCPRCQRPVAGIGM